MTVAPEPDTQKSAMAGGAWTVIERIAAQASQLIIFIVAARMLGPAEFGVFALVSACAILLLRMSEFGWAQYIMSWAGDTTVPRQVLLIAILCGAIFAAFGVGTGLLLPWFGLSAQTAQLVMLFSFWVMLATTSTAQKGIMIWQDKLKSSAASETLGELSGLIVALVCLFSGFGVLSLVFGRLTFQTVHLIISFSATRMTPLFGLKGTHLHEMLTFSGQLFASRMIANIRLYAATFIIGGFLGPAAVGYYRAAERLVGAIAEIVFVPTEVLSWSLFRKARARFDGRLDGFQTQANVFFRILFALAVPVFIWLTLMGPDLIRVLLGPEWLPALPIVAILALSRALMLPGLPTEAILSLAGEIRRLIPFTLFFLVLSVLLTLIAVQFGIYAVALAQLAVSIGTMIAATWMQRRYAMIRWRTVLLGSRRIILPLAIGTAMMVGMLYSGSVADLPPFLRMGAVSLATLFVYVAALLAVEPQLRAYLPKIMQTSRLVSESPS